MSNKLLHVAIEQLNFNIWPMECEESSYRSCLSYKAFTYPQKCWLTSRNKICPYVTSLFSHTKPSLASLPPETLTDPKKQDAAIWELSWAWEHKCHILSRNTCQSLLGNLPAQPLKLLKRIVLKLRFGRPPPPFPKYYYNIHTLTFVNESRWQK